MNKYLPHLAIIIAALLWSLDAFLRQSLYTLSPLLIITLEHGIGSLLFTPILVNNWEKLKTLKQTVWISLLWISILGGICGTYFYTKRSALMCLTNPPCSDFVIGQYLGVKNSVLSPKMLVFGLSRPSRAIK